MKQKWGIILPFLALLFSSIFYIPGAARIFSGRMGVSFPHGGLAVAGILISLSTMALAWLSFPRVHNFRVTWIGFLIPSMAIHWYILDWVPIFDRGPVPLYFWALYMLGHMMLFLILPDSAKRKTTFWSVVLLSLIQAAVFLLVRYFAALLPGFGGLLLQNESLILSLFFIAALVGTVLITAKTARNGYYIGGMISALLLFSALFFLRGRFSYDSGFRSVEALNLFFFFVSLLLGLGILLHWFARVEHKVNYDPLLKVYNRQYALQILEEKSSMRTSAPFSIAMADIDFFKKVNDSYGHQAGDDVLFEVAQKVQQSVIPEGVLCRYGGEELVIFFPGLERKEAAKLLEQVRTQVEKHTVRSGHHRIQVTLSFGVSDRQDNSEPLQNVLQVADKALYAAKKAGRNCIKCAAPRRQPSVTKKIAAAADPPAGRSLKGSG